MWTDVGLDANYCRDLWTSDHYAVSATIGQTTEPPLPTPKLDPTLFTDHEVRPLILDLIKNHWLQHPTRDEGHARSYETFKTRLTALVFDVQKRRGREKRQNKSETTKLQELLQETVESETTPNRDTTTRIQSIIKRIRSLYKLTRVKTADDALQKLLGEERSSREFYKRFKARFAHASIPSLYKVTDWSQPPTKFAADHPTTESLKETLEEAKVYWEQLYRERKSVRPKKLLDLLKQKQISKSEKEYCERGMTEEEVRKAIRTMANRKSAGPDLIPAEFYRNFENEIAPILVGVFKEMHQDGELSTSFRQGDIALIYKKKDPRDIRNYRPITCLNADYKIMTKLIVARLARTLDSIIDEAQKGFVPKRLIHENTYLTQLIQAYLEENDEEGMILALDCEKAFDRCSWDYLLSAMHSLGFGPSMVGLIRTIYNKNSPPIRRLKVGGIYSEFFPLGAGVPQGCPASAVVFLFITEGMSRLLKSELPGITINGHKFVLSQFADDTVCYVRNYTDLPKLWSLLQEWCDATGMALNRNKTEGIRLGRTRRSPVPTETFTEGINWVKPGDWITILGVPFGENLNLDRFYEEKYAKCKLLLSHWHAVKGLTSFGRAMIVNALIYSRFRYWTYCHPIPNHVNACIESDVHAIIWDKNFAPHPDELGTETKSKPFMKSGAALRSKRKLGLGLLHWPSHIKAIQSQLITHYLNGTRSSWKILLDNWFDRTPIGRGAVFSTTPIKDLTKTTGSRKSALPPIFKQALSSFREIDFVKVVSGEFISSNEAKAEPTWSSRLFSLSNHMYYQTWMIECTFNRVRDYFTPWGELWTPTLVYNYVRQNFKLDKYSGFVKIRGSLPVDPDALAQQWATFVTDCPKYILEAARHPNELATVSDTTPTYSEVAQRLMRKQGWKPGQGLGATSQGITELDSWNTPSTKPRAALGNTAKNAKSKKRTLYCKPDDAGNHTYGYVKSTPNAAPKFQIAELTPLGKPRVTGEHCDLDFEPAEVLWWNATVLGPAEATYPHPRGWTVNTLGTPITLDSLTVKKLTAIFRHHLEEPPTCITSWPRYLATPITILIPWDAIGSRLCSPLTTTRDIHSWFKNILHRRMMVRDLVPHEGSSTCRLCNLTYERLEHLASCPVIHQLFLTLHSLTLNTTSTNDTCSPYFKILGCTRTPNDPDDLKPLPPGLYSLFLIVWKFTIINFTSIDINSDRFSADNIWISSLRRFMERVNAFKQSFYHRHLGALSKGATAPSAARLNSSLYPLAHLTDDAALTYHPALLALFSHHSLHHDEPSPIIDHGMPPLHKPIAFVEPMTQQDERARPRRGGGGV